MQKHVWIHDHILEVNPSYYGVRLSFALSEWIDLGKKYPKALETLESIRDKKVSRLLAGETDRRLFHDVESINEHLGELNATVELFKKLEAANPSFATSIFDIADDALVQAQEFTLARKHLGDPEKRFATAKRRFEEGLRYAKTSQHGEASRKAFENIFTDEVVRLIRVLDKTGDQSQAQKLQAEALKLLDNAAIRDAIAPLIQ